ncbi:MAG: electron transfer flavoprotein subunit alpha/FixB family protein [Thermodesulfobacteriota bacterium]
MKEIWAYVEMAAGKVLRPSQEALSEAVRQGRHLQARTTALVLGHGIPEEGLDTVCRYGPDRILVLDDERLSDYGTEPYAACIETLLQEHKPDAFLLGGSAVSRDLAPRLSARLKSSLVTEATFLNPQGGRWMVTRSAYRPHASMIVAPADTGLQIITLAPKVMDAEEAGSPDRLSVEAVEAPRNLRGSPVHTEERIREIPSQLDITDAEVIVAGGKGMQNEEGFALLDELAEVVGGTVGATRMAVDMKWRSRESMVGVTGKMVSPEVYIACGISGAIQHVMGMRSSQTILAINTDQNAPIFRIATLGIVGAVREVLPVMIRSFREMKAKAEAQGERA